MVSHAEGRVLTQDFQKQAPPTGHDRSLGSQSAQASKESNVPQHSLEVIKTTFGWARWVLLSVSTLPWEKLGCPAWEKVLWMWVGGSALGQGSATACLCALCCLPCVVPCSDCCVLCLADTGLLWLCLHSHLYGWNPVKGNTFLLDSLYHVATAVMVALFASLPDTRLCGLRLHGYFCFWDHFKGNRPASPLTSAPPVLEAQERCVKCFELFFSSVIKLNFFKL